MSAPHFGDNAKNIITHIDMDSKTLMSFASAFESLAKKKKPWTDLPKGWKKKTVKEVASKLIKGKHPHAACTKKMKGKVSDPESFCASLKDIKKPGWREREAKKRNKE